MFSVADEIRMDGGHAHTYTPACTHTRASTLTLTNVRPKSRKSGRLMPMMSNIKKDNYTVIHKNIHKVTAKITEITVPR